MSQVLQPASLVADYLNFGVYNMNFYVHTPFSFQLSVSPQSRVPVHIFTLHGELGSQVGVVCSLNLF